jgi:hypothetical protein
MDEQKLRIEIKTKAACNTIAGGFFFSSRHKLRRFSFQAPPSKFSGHFDVAIGPVPDNTVVRETGGNVDFS